MAGSAFYTSVDTRKSQRWDFLVFPMNAENIVQKTAHSEIVKYSPLVFFKDGKLTFNDLYEVYKKVINDLPRQTSKDKTA